MKKVLITGVNSYVGNSLAKWLGKNPDHYAIDRISLRYGSWREKDFSPYDVVIHVAGIAHSRETKSNADIYFNINRDLTYEVAQKAKKESVDHFIFLSSMSVYGLDEGVIDENTPLKPTSNYGKSKLQAEQLIESLNDIAFKVAIVRPPMIYGKGCKGNYQRLSKLAMKAPVFPDINNQRSMIYVDNLSEFVKELIKNSGYGLFYPQNKEYVRTSEMVRLISEVNSKPLKLTSLFNPVISLLKFSLIQKIFGNLVYAKSLTNYSEIKYYCIIDFQESIKLTEEKEERRQ